MSRHRGVKNIIREDDLDEDYSRSYEDKDYGCSPATEQLYTYYATHTMSSFLPEQPERVNEVDEPSSDELLGNSPSPEAVTIKELSARLSGLSMADKVSLMSGMDYLFDILGDNVDPEECKRCLLEHNFDAEKALDNLMKLRASVSEPRGKSRCVELPSTPRSSACTLSGGDTASPAASQMKQALGPEPKTGLLRAQFEIPPTPANTPAKHQGLLDDSRSFMKSLLDGNLLSKVNEVDVKQRRREGKGHVNLVVIGHVDAGKSTLIGHLLYQLGNVQQKLIHKYEVESAKIGKSSFAFAWVLDETEEERTRGITTDVAMTKFETKTKIVSLLDSPGHRDFIPNMIQGTSQADAGILVVDSAPGAFESGFCEGGQTREHTLLAKSLGVSQLIVAVNKLELSQWSSQRFEQVLLSMKPFLRQVGYKESEISFIPISGWLGENVTKPAQDPVLSSWYHGGCLLDLIDNLQEPERCLDRPLRFSVADVFKGQGSSVQCCGKLETGTISTGDRVLVQPAGESCMVKGLTVHDDPVKTCYAGEQATITLASIDPNNLGIGCLLSDPNSPAHVATKIQATLVVLDVDIPITQGHHVVLHCHNYAESAVISKLIHTVNKTTGETLQKRPRFLAKFSKAEVEIQIGRPMAVDLYQDNKSLGRFMLRHSGRTVCGGIVTKILQ